MKIAMLCPRTPRLYFSGIENYVSQVSKRLEERGLTVEIFTTSPEPKEMRISKVLIREFLGYSPSESYYISPELYFALRKSDADIIHCNGYNNLVTLAGILAKKSNQKLVVTINSAGISSYFRRILHIPYAILLNALKDRIDKIICVSENEYSIFTKKIHLFRNFFMIIPNGVDKEFIESIEIKEKKNSIISIGRLVKNKGFHHVLSAFKLLREDDMKLHLNIVGSGPYKEELVRLVKQLKLDENVSFLGTIPFNEREKLIKLLKEAKLFVLLSDYEGNPIIVLETLAAKVPMLLTNRGVMAEYIKKGYAVGVNNPKNHKEVSEKMKMILDSPEDYIPKNPEMLNWDDVTNKLIEVYNGRQ